MTVPLEHESVARSRCRRCGRDWPGIVDGTSADLGALMREPPERREAFAKCWVGRCVEPDLFEKEPRMIPNPTGSAEPLSMEDPV